MTLDLECDECKEPLGTIETEAGDSYGKVICLGCSIADEEPCEDDEGYI